MESIDLIRESLSEPGDFPVPTRTVCTRETHISLVLMTDSRVYKCKKPVRFPFLDFSSLEGRLWACEEEIRLNRRLAPNVYLGVLPITKENGKARIGGSGPIIDYCVEMVRLDESLMLDQRIAAGTATSEEIDRLLAVLIPFYASLPRSHESNALATTDAIEAVVRENLSTIESILPPEDISFWRRIRSSQLQYLALNENAFQKRIDEGHIVEGHGDLRPEHVCLSDPVVVFDAVEFSRAFRTSDIASELAFLAMELDFLNAPELGRALIEGYEHATGEPIPSPLRAFYQAYRATVRAKVELLRSTQETDLEAAVQRQRFHRYAHLSAAYASQFHQPIAILMVGAAGVGKSTIAAKLADRMGPDIVRTDQCRQELAGTRDPEAGAGEGIYGPEWTDATYLAVLRKAELSLNHGISVILDGTFVDPLRRQQVREWAHDLGTPLSVVWCQCEPRLAHQRIEQRRRVGTDISDARPEIHDQHVEQLEKAEDLSEPSAIHLDTALAVEDNVGRIIDALRRSGSVDVRND